MECDLPPELNLGFSKLCSELQLFLNKTESCLHLAKENFKQVDYIWKPWNIPKDYHLNKCSCSASDSTYLSKSSEHSDLMDNVSKTLKHAESMRNMSLKSNLKQINRKPNTSVASTRKNSIPLRKTVSNQTASSSNTIHLPSCPLFNSPAELFKKESSLSLCDALTYYKMPSSLKRVHNFTFDIINAKKLEQSTKMDYKAIFIHKLQCHNEQVSSSLREDTLINMLFTCVSAFHTYEKKQNSKDDSTSWIFYRDWNYLKKYVFSQHDIVIREYWTLILSYILNELIPLLQKYELSQKQKLHLFKIVKTIVNFVNSTVPSVPIFRCEK